MKKSDLKKIDVSSFILHIIAMICMLIDHIYFTRCRDFEILNCIGRIAFPIFAFLSVEGFFHTHNFKKYITRLFIAALISEIPFNLMVNHTVKYSEAQNVLWTFLIGLSCIKIIEIAKKKYKKDTSFYISVVTVVLASYIALLIKTDYSAWGVLTMLVFYFFHDKTKLNQIIQFILLVIIHIFAMSFSHIDVTILGVTIPVIKQGFALLALIPIWMYKGRQGPHNKVFQIFCYLFYPVHMFLLSL